MARPKVYPDEFRARAARLVREWRETRGVSEGGYTAVAEQLGIKPETLRRRFIDEEVEGGTRRGVTREERSRLADLERGAPGAAQTNDILRSAAVFMWSRDHAEPTLPAVASSFSQPEEALSQST